VETDGLTEEIAALPPVLTQSITRKLRSRIDMQTHASQPSEP